MRHFLTAIALSTVLAPGAANARENLEPPAPKKATKICAEGPARLKNVKGAVLLSRGGGFSRASEGMRLAAGDHIIARDGFARVVIGGAIAAEVGNGVMLTIAETDGSVCVARITANPAAVGQAAGEGQSIGVEGLLVTGGALGAIGGGLGSGLSGNGSGNAPNGLPPLLSP